MSFSIRNWLYFIIGLFAAVLGWSLSQVLIVDLQPIWDKFDFTFFSQYPYLVKFFIITTFLAISMVMAEVFLSNPTRLSAGKRVLKYPFLIAIGLSIIAVTLSVVISTLLKSTSAPAWFIRLTDWLIIGTTIGFAEGFTWLLRSFTQAVLGDKIDSTKVIKHFMSSVSIGLLLSIVIFFISEQALEKDFLSFMLLGGVLGFALSFTTSPNTQLALKVGYGFERISGNPNWLKRACITKKAVKSKKLKFVRDSRENKSPYLEEGLSIQLPSEGEIVVGSDIEQADIVILDLPKKAAIIKVKGRKADIQPCGKNLIQTKNSEIIIKPPDYDHQQTQNEENPYETVIQNNTSTQENSSSNDNDSEELINELDTLDYALGSESACEFLRHNTLITFYTITNIEKKKYVRFVFYDRFLDPEG